MNKRRTLSPLQKIVTELLCQGMSTKEVAGHLQIGESTTQNIISIIMLKTGTKTRAELAAKAVKQNLVNVYEYNKF